MVCSPDRARYEISGPPFYFLINFREEAQKIPASFIGGRDLLTGKTIEPEEAMEKFEVRIIQKD